MPSMSTVLLVICISLALGSIGQGAPILDDLFRGFVHDSQLAPGPAKEGSIVKRRIYADNPDSRLKQVSLQSLIGDIEDNLYNTALSVSHVAHNDEVKVEEVTPLVEADNDRTITKRETEDKVAATSTANGQFVTTEATPASKQIYLQTTQKVPAANGVPAHVLIDRVAVQPHEGGLPFIPAFQVYHTKVISATFKEPSKTTNADGSTTNAEGQGTKSTKITVAQTAVQTTGNTASGTVPVITISTTNTHPSESTETAATPTVTLSAAAPTTVDATKSTSTTIQLQNVPVSSLNPESTSTTTTTAATTTKLPIVQLKEEEKELKEKVAEIEAEPVILSARV